MPQFRSAQRLFSCVACSMLLAIASRASAQQLLQLKYEEGDATKSEWRSESATTVTLQGTATQSNNLQIIDIKEVARELERDRILFDKTIERLRFSISNSRGAKLNFDSKNPEATAQAPPAVKSFGVLANLTFTSAVNPRGELVQTDLGQKMRAALAEKTPGEQANLPLTESGLQELAGASYLLLPPAPVQPGDTWSMPQVAADPLLGKQGFDLNYTYEGKTENAGQMVDRVRFVAKYDPPTPPNDKATVNVHVQRLEGEFLFDSEKGRMVELSSRKEFEAQITSGGQVILQRVVSRNGIKVSAVDAAP